ncbi:MurG-like transferase [Pseudobythopirellula maris]|uniref:MurG-like transferase n=1 Tax=Pseudobythopirellula maris TaxID=2527991 RepID=A0A5C5ZHB7_9BACT|nr:glycosyltransferase [Pseudobythopirellula maris]TWT86271.1 MurG-like transferase [Pseudobythopirellula maris]
MLCLLTALGSYGDVYPVIKLGAALAERGHRVKLLANPYFAEPIERAGLELVPVSTPEAYERLTHDRRLWHPLLGLRVIFRWAATEAMPDIYQALERLHEPGETVIGAHPLDFASRVAAEALGANVTSIVYAPMTVWSDDSPPRLPGGLAGLGWPRWWNRMMLTVGELLVERRSITGRINAFRAQKGLGRIGRVYPDWAFGTGHTLCLYPEWFGPTPIDLPGEFDTSGFPLGGEPDAPLDAGLEAFLQAGDAPIVFTPGTANRAGRAFFAAALDACRRLGARGVLLTKYPEQLPDPLPDYAHWASLAPLGPLLSRSAAFVHHGGIGSSAQGLAAGAPQLIQPMAFDQLDNAHRLIELGVAEELLPRAFTGAAVAAALSRLLGSTDTARQCEDLAARCDSKAALDEACESLERRVGIPTTPAKPVTKHLAATFAKLA